ncbi:tetratricopeptide repeat protein [Balneola sp. MJW-20]|uniref:tetratricopeptide repeat-containing sensor histidine kinase n=1 Tax=Gracilimonas aurantiaca TaxID=3234185 RepID=UPI003465049C
MLLNVIIALLVWAGDPSPDIPLHYNQTTVQDADLANIRDQLKEADRLIDQGKVIEARQLITKSRREADSLGLKNAEKDLLLSYSVLYLAEQKYDSAMTATQQGLRMDLEDSLEVKYLNQLGTILRFQSDYVESLKAYNRAYNLAKELNDKDYTIGILQNMAVSYKGIGQLDRSIQHFTEALSYAREVQDTTLLIVVTNNIGDTYNDMEEFDKASVYLKESSELAALKGYQSDLLRVTTNLAISQSGLKRYEQALGLYQNALELSEEVRPGIPPFQIEYNLGQLYLEWGMPDSASKYFNASLEACLKYGIGQGIYYNNLGLAELSKNKGNNEMALLYLEDAYDLARESGSLNDIKESSGLLYELHKLMGDNSKALTYFEEKEQAEDSLSAISTQQAVAETEARLELVRQQTINERLEAEKAKQDAVLANQQVIIIAGAVIVLLIIAGMIYVIRSDRKVAKINRELRKQKEKLELASKEKDRLFAIIAHDMRSPLTSLQGFIYLLQSSELTKEEIDEITSELEISVQKNLNLMKDLLTWAKDQMAGLKIFLRDVDLRVVSDDVLQSNRFISNKKEICVTNNIPGETYLRADYDALEIILRNLMVNAIKFTPKGGKISLNLEQSNGSAVVSVSDTGIGIPEELREDIFEKFDGSRKGTQGEKGSGFGLNLSQQLAKKMGGRIYFESEVGKGSTFYIELRSAGH